MMWVKRISIVACFLAALVHAQRRPPPTRSPTTPTLFTTAPPETSETPSTTSGPIRGQEGCISKFATIQSANRFIVITKRGRARSFRANHPELVNETFTSSDGSGRELPVRTVVNLRQAESVRNYSVSHRSFRPLHQMHAGDEGGS